MRRFALDGCAIALGRLPSALLQKIEEESCFSGLLMLTGESSEEEFPYDSEIERTLHRRRKEACGKQEKDELQTEIPEEEMAANANLSLRQLGLLSHDKSMLDAASGGVFVDKTPVQVRNLIENMAANSQKFGTVRSYPTPGRNNEVNVSSLEQKLIDLTSLVRQMAVGNGQNMMVCGICTARGHATDMCPTLQEGSAEQVNTAGGFPEPPQRKYDPYSNTYNLGWKDHPNLRYGNPQVIQAPPHNPAYRPPYPRQPQHPQVPTPGNLSKENVSAITLRSGKELKFNEEVVKEPVQNKDEQESKVEEDDTISEAPRGKFPPLFEYKLVAPFPLALKESRKDEGIKVLYEVFRRCEGCQKVELREQVSAVIQRKVPTKCKDSGLFLETDIVVQMTDKSSIFPRGVIEDVFVKVGNLIFPADFYVLDMKNNDLNSPTLLGRPFLKTSKSIIDVDNGTLTMELDGEIVKFNIFDTLKIPSCDSVVNNIDVNDHLSHEHEKDVNEVSQMPPPPQTKFQYDSSVMLSDVEEDSANT
ncbi:uncharacterized protein [Henckelia pumila]|uniref:uncharacterized protein n=1 Tax=Henckelia pumila TaxID=405737 RepID=UPI003C6E7528